ncbi:MAG TPA: tetraacyldisaccharide 4'-kinase [Myxococcota bacterium]|nr:tetraacyldisaccharide 4'-kinase [Myxococcota bacterium]HRY93856.1 tetraacyldisaccharide 4'-kinase [Myxococcota bacterium]
MSRTLERLWYDPAPSAALRGLGAGLAPLAWAYAAGLRLRPGARPEGVGRPVVSVGNLVAGGSGKTPLVMALVDLLEAAGLRVALVSRGYGRRTRGVRVGHLPGGRLPTWEEVGDEPALLARRCPGAALVVGEDRVAAARRAVEVAAPDLIVCDDAFQHRALARELDLVAVHAGRGFGNGRLLPRGPLREPLAALTRAHAVVLTHHQGTEPPAALAARLGVPAELPVVGLELEPDGLLSAGGGRAGVPAEPVVAGAAIAHFEGFLGSLAALGVRVAAGLSFPDHHRLGPAALVRLERLARASGAAAVVVTEKDLVKLPAAGDQLPLLALRLEARWVGPAARRTVLGWLLRAAGR